MMKRRLLAPLAMALLLLLAGCGSAPTNTAAPAAASTPTSGSSRPACHGIATINTALTSLSQAGNNITVGQLKTIQSGIGVALKVVDKLAPADASATLDQLKAANDQLAQTLAGLPENDTLGQHGPQLQQFKEQVAKAQAAASQLATKLNC